MSVNELEAVGIERMDQADIDGFLTSQGVGILGLPTETHPYLLPLSFGYDGQDLYFTFVTGEESRKAELSQRAETATFLVYDAPSRFSWQSVVLTGTVTGVPEREWDDLSSALANAWHPDVFETADLGGGISVYRFRVENRAGRKQTGLPPEFRSGADEESPD